jgi:exopolysaccharide biosynthesis polyprenyl glycosylphosphotransferase
LPKAEKMAMLCIARMKRLPLFLTVFQVPLDIVALVVAGMGAFALRHSDWVTAYRPVIFTFSLGEYVTRLVLPIAITVFFFACLGLYRQIGTRRLVGDMGHIVTGLTMSLAAVALALLFTQSVFDSRFLVVATYGFAIIAVAVGRLCIFGVKVAFYRHGVGARSVFFVGDGVRTKKLKDIFIRRPDLGYRVVGEAKTWDETIRVLEGRKVDQILFTEGSLPHADGVAAIQYAAVNHIIFSYVADVFDTYNVHMTIHPVAGMPLVELGATALEGWGRVVKRMVDIVFGVLFFLLTAPISLVSAVIILLETGRPVLYKNERVGVVGTRFMTLKFRSMYQKDSTGAQFGDAGALAEQKETMLIKERNTRQGPIYKIGDDPRVTPVGKWLRRFSIDELPQLVNVIRGDMSLVGPRPHQPREVSHYDKVYPQIFAIKPGITGLAQISGRSDLSFEEEMRLDTYYVERWSVWLDFLILLKTPFVLLRRRRAL